MSDRAETGWRRPPPQEPLGEGAVAGLLASDRAARAEAQTRFDRPLVLEAGAGTGKTTTLIARLLAWCLGDGWDKAAQSLPAGASSVLDGAAGGAGGGSSAATPAAGVTGTRVLRRGGGPPLPAAGGAGDGGRGG